MAGTASILAVLALDFTRLALKRTQKGKGMERGVKSKERRAKAQEERAEREDVGDRKSAVSFSEKH